MADKKQAFWLNLWQASNVDHVPPEEKRLQELIPDFDALHAIAKKIMRLPRLSPEPPLLLDAMSYIIVPPALHRKLGTLTSIWGTARAWCP